MLLCSNETSHVVSPRWIVVLADIATFHYRNYTPTGLVFTSIVSVPTLTIRQYLIASAYPGNGASTEIPCGLNVDGTIDNDQTPREPTSNHQ